MKPKIHMVDKNGNVVEVDENCKVIEKNGDVNMMKGVVEKVVSDEYSIIITIVVSNKEYKRVPIVYDDVVAIMELIE